MSSDQIILDIAESMKISNVEIDGKEAQFDNQGQALLVQTTGQQSFNLKINYELDASKAKGIQWLKKGDKPFIFTDFQSIKARTVFPI